jgi:hypothetical protein
MERFNRLLLTMIALAGAWFLWQAIELRKLKIVAREVANDKGDESRMFEQIRILKKAEMLVVAKLAPPAADPSGRREKMALRQMTDRMLRQDPAYRALLRREVLPLFRTERMKAGMDALGISADKRDKLVDLMVAQEAGLAGGAVEAAISGGVAYNSPEMAQAKALENKQLLDIERELLGPDVFKDFGELLGQNTMASVYKSALEAVMTDAGMDLTAEQSDELAKVQIEAVTNGVWTQVDPQNGVSKGQQALLEKASKILSPDQVLILKGYFDEQSRLSLIRQQVIAGARASGEIGPEDSGAIEMYGAGDLYDIQFRPSSGKHQ